MNFIVTFLFYVTVGTIKIKSYQLRNILIKQTIFKRYLKWSNKLYRIWKIQLTIEINFMSSKDNNEEFGIYLRSDKIELMNNNKKMKLQNNAFNHFFLNIKLDRKHQLNAVILSLIILICCDINVIEQILNMMDHIQTLLIR